MPTGAGWDTDGTQIEQLTHVVTVYKAGTNEVAGSAEIAPVAGDPTPTATISNLVPGSYDILVEGVLRSVTPEKYYSVARKPGVTIIAGNNDVEITMEPPSSYPYTVTLVNSVTGSSTPVTSQTVVHGGRVTPDTLAWSGHTLTGWYTNEDFSGSPWDFSSGVVKNNMTLYAKWTPGSAPVPQGIIILAPTVVPQGQLTRESIRALVEYDDGSFKEEPVTWSITGTTAIGIDDANPADVYLDGTALAGETIFTIQSDAHGLTETHTVYVIPNSGGGLFRKTPTGLSSTTVSWGVNSTYLVNAFNYVNTPANSGEYIFVVTGSSIAVDDTAGSQTLSNNSTLTITGVTGGEKILCAPTTPYGPLFSVNSGAELILENIILQGGTPNPNISALVEVVGLDSTLTMNRNSQITNNYSDYDGGGVSVLGGTLTLNGGSIKANTADGNGGGVRIDDNGTFTMISGEIANNYANAGGNGGGVYMYSGIFNMIGGYIGGNTASNNGGGVFVEGGVFTKAVSSDASIYGNAGSATPNTASGGAGHAVYVMDPQIKYRDNTAGPTISIDSTTGEGLPLP